MISYDGWQSRLIFVARTTASNIMAMAAAVTG
jgi:hypothetical protein